MPTHSMHIYADVCSACSLACVPFSHFCQALEAAVAAMEDDAEADGAAKEGMPPKQAATDAGAHRKGAAAR